MSKLCENKSCTNVVSKNKWGNYLTYCCNECMKQNRAIKFKNTYANIDIDAIAAKRKATVMKKYGEDNVSKTKAVRDKLSITTAATSDIRIAKTKATNLKNHGVESTNSLQSIKDKKKETFTEKYGVDHQLKRPEVAASVSQKNKDNAVERLAKARETNLERYGCENPSSNVDVQAKRTETMIKRFGVENASQNAGVHQKKIKNSYKSKDYILPSGKIIKLQGYEWMAINQLLESYNENDIITDTRHIPVFEYADIHGKKRKYFPDIYIPKDKLIIEVKSEWTYTQNKTIADLKRDACVAAGYSFRFMIMTDK